MRRSGGACALALLACTAALPATAQGIDSFYRSRSVTLNIATAVGGGYDAYSRLLARHMGRFIPGNPTIVPKNMPGAGGIQAGNHMYNAAAKDGSEIAMIPASVITLPLFGDAAAKFDMSRFTWLGSMNKDSASCGTSVQSGVQRFDDLFTREVSFGASGTGGILAQHPMAFNAVLGTRTKVIMGYKGSSDVKLAVERGEVDGSCAIVVSTLKQQWEGERQAGRFRIIVQLGLENHPAYGEAPNIYRYAKSEEDRQVLQLIFGQSVLGRPILAPPEVPAERLQALRTAFTAVLGDRQFLAEAEQAQMEINPAAAGECEALLQQFAAFSPRVIERAKKAIGE